MVNGGKPRSRKLHVAEIDGHVFTIKNFVRAYYWYFKMHYERVFGKQC